jgi:hypothetical protein
MFNRTVVQKALTSSWTLDKDQGWIPYDSADDKSSVTSQLIYDIYGGEILKTHEKNGWHFYNRINGERIDFTRSIISKSSENYSFEDIPSTPDETHIYFEQEEYATLLIRFIRAFEEAIGLKSTCVVPLLKVVYMI